MAMALIRYISIHGVEKIWPLPIRKADQTKKAGQKAIDKQDVHGLLCIFWRDAETQPLEGLLGQGRHIGAHAAHKEVLGLQADIGFIGLQLLEAMASEDVDQHIAVLQCRQAGAFQIPGPGIADHVNDHLLQTGVA
jgi:hypothetical protein